MEEIFQNIIMYNSINRNDSENVFDYVREENSNEIRHFSLQIRIWGKGVVLGLFRVQFGWGLGFKSNHCSYFPTVRYKVPILCEDQIVSIT